MTITVIINKRLLLKSKVKLLKISFIDTLYGEAGITLDSEEMSLHHQYH